MGQHRGWTALSFSEKTADDPDMVSGVVDDVSADMQNGSLQRTLVIFSHGKESGPDGRKIRHLAAIARQRGALTLSPSYVDLSCPEQRVQRLLGLSLPAHDNLVLVGSSMGGYVSVVASSVLRPQGLFLIAPAVYMPGYAQNTYNARASRLAVVCGRQDEVIPVTHGIQFAHEHQADLHVVEGDHRLNRQLHQLGRLFELFLDTLQLCNGHTQEQINDSGHEKNG